MLARNITKITEGEPGIGEAAVEWKTPFLTWRYIQKTVHGEDEIPLNTHHYAYNINSIYRDCFD